MRNYSQDILVEHDEWGFFQSPTSSKMGGTNNAFAGGASNMKLIV